jgi:hypothetical protein
LVPATTDERHATDGGSGGGIAGFFGGAATGFEHASIWMDLVRMGTECRHRGTELVIPRDADFRVMMVMEFPVASIAHFRARATAAGTSLEPMSEVLEVTEYGGHKRH